MNQQPQVIDINQIGKIEAVLKEQFKRSLDNEKIVYYAESLSIPWKDIYAGDLVNPTLEEIQQAPGPWLMTPAGPKPFAHLYQRKVTYPWEYPDLFERWKTASFYIWDAGNRGGKSVCLNNFGSMLMLGIHPLQTLGLKRKPPIHAWIVSPNLPSESDVPRGEDAPILKKVYEWIPDMDAGYTYGIKKFYRKDKIMTVVDKNKVESVLNFKSYDQEKSKMKSEDVDIILFDEDHPSLPGFWEEAKARIIDRNGCIFLGFTPDFGSAYTYSMITRERNNPAYYINAGEAGAEENPFLSRESVKKITGAWSGDERTMRAKGIHIQFKGKVFPFEYDKHVGRPFTPTRETTQYVIIDWHPAKPIIITYLSINVKGIWYVFKESVIEDHVVEKVAKEYFRSLTMPDMKLKVRKTIIDKIAEIEQAQEKGYRSKSIVDMLRQFDIRCDIGKTEFESAHAFITRKLNYKELWFDPSCHTHIEQFDTWGAKRYQKGQMEGTLRDQLESEGNDTCMNLVYAYNGGAKFINENENVFEFPPPRRPATERIYGRMR